jgi:mannose-6-phosphate isomerase-like protein (cupin superfamily)
MSPRLITQPIRIPAPGNKLKRIDEYIGRVVSQTEEVSVAHMFSPGGWEEVGQTPQFTEYSVVLRGTLRADFKNGHIEAHAGQAIIVPKGTWVKYSTPEAEGAEYIAVCTPAFSAESACRDK